MRSLLKISYPLALLALSFAVPSAAQIPTPTGGDTSHITVKSQLVVLDTVVTDRKGNIVTNLTRDDFQIYEDGLPQKLRDFDSPANRPPVPEAPKKDRNGNDDWGSSPLTIIVVDEMNTPFTEISYAKQCVEKYLKSQPEQLTEPTILLWLNDAGLKPVTTFTRDRATILQGLLKHPPSAASRLARGASVDMIASSFSALQQAALFSRGEPGKKELLWVGRSFPGLNGQSMDYTDKELLAKALHSTIDLLLASRVTLYVIDPTLGTSADFSNPAAITNTDQIEPIKTNIQDPFENGFNMNLFVDQTGGKYYRGMNDLDREVSDSVQRGVGFYTLTYSPSYRETPSEYHQITVRTKDPNLIVQTKEGYYSAAPPDMQTPKEAAKREDNDMRFDLYEATVINMPYTGLGLHVQQCQRDAEDSGSSCKISVDSGTLTFANNSSKNEEQTTILAVVSSLDAKGKILNHTSQEQTLGVPESQASLIRTGNLPVTLRTLVPAGTTRIRIVLRDVSGRIGTAEVDSAQVPALVSSTVLKKSMK